MSIAEEEVATTDDANGTFDARIRHRRAFRPDPTRRRNRTHGKIVVWLCLGWLALMVILAVGAQWLPLKNPETVVGIPNINPNWSREFLGTDAIGHSMLSRLVFGARVSMEISFLVGIFAMAAGTAVGLMSVYFRGAMRVIADTIANTILSIPGLLFLLVLIIVLGPSIPVLIFVIALLFFPGFMRVTRANASSLVVSEYIIAAQSLGASSTRVIIREFLPNTLVSLVTLFSIAMPGAMVTEGGLSYLGFGVQPPTPSWGEMIAQGQNQLTVAPWQAILPCLIFVATVFSLYTAGDWLRAKVDIRGNASQ